MTIKELIQKFYTPEVGNADVRINTLSVGTNPIRVLENNFNRFQYILINLSSNDIYINYTSKVSNSNGIVLPASGGYSISNWKDDLMLTAYEVYAVASGASSNLLVIEYILI
jgi:hypothetical protein